MLAVLHRSLCCSCFRTECPARFQDLASIPLIQHSLCLLFIPGDAPAGGRSRALVAGQARPLQVRFALSPKSCLLCLHSWLAPRCPCIGSAAVLRRPGQLIQLPDRVESELISCRASACCDADARAATNRWATASRAWCTRRARSSTCRSPQRCVVFSFPIVCYFLGSIADTVLPLLLLLIAACPGPLRALRCLISGSVVIAFSLSRPLFHHVSLTCAGLLGLLHSTPSGARAWTAFQRAPPRP